jgi:hypothetical protein
MIIKYVLNSDGTIPDYVEDGGYFTDGDDVAEAKIGKAVASGVPSDAPATTSGITKSDLIARVSDFLLRYPPLQTSHAIGTFDTRTAEEIVDAWCVQVGEA